MAGVRSLACTATAVLSASLLLAAAACDGGSDSKSTEPNSLPPPVPSELADGTTPAPMPDGVRRFRGRPVIQAKELPGQAAQLLCPESTTYRNRANPIGGWISTDGLGVGYAITDESVLFSCDAAFVDGHWERCAEKALALDTLSPEELTRAERASICEEPAPPRGFLWAAVPAGSAWALVDHRSFWVAYLAVNKPAVRVSSTEGVDSDSSRGALAFVDQRGRTVLEREIEDGRIVEARPSG
jgi:hypothetical protein